MATIGKSANIFFFQVFLVLSLLLAVTMAEKKLIKGGKILEANSTPECDTGFAVRAGDSCSSVAETFSLTSDFFDSINPNLDCDSLFLGQWLCVQGTPS
ncbi:hypothetical protein ACJRO7_021680 [Eucalyptus globulus]|uniref:LysM domain-containing protein n=1 Tax=Eucalyptus globulus TaxID=34317 RepID=A0ABD3KM47_EUCGL